MRCNNCHGYGQRWSLLTQQYLHCMECNGSGITSCCEGNPNMDEWWTKPIKLPDDAKVLIINTKFDMSGNLVEIKTLVNKTWKDQI